jgi:hypothetical protein
MKTFVFALSLWSMGLQAQSLPSAQKLVDGIMSSSTVAHPLDKRDVENFAGELLAALRGRTITAAQMEAIHTALHENLRSSGSNYLPAKHLQDALADAGVTAEEIHRIIGPFLRIGEEMRGPDDAPAADSK